MLNKLHVYHKYSVNFLILRILVQTIILGNGLDVLGTESDIEINFALVKFKHKVHRKRRENLKRSVMFQKRKFIL
ncbi:MAG: hypothetical protein FWH22_05365 [Fibromonadales bacterium]|nr:hypothetical protein [Fibromonadales bacterium]